MPRKSPRTTTTTYRRQQLTWDDTESCSVNHNHDKGLILLNSATVAKMTSDRFVSPSPGFLSTSTTVGKDEPSQKLSSGRELLFTEKGRSRRKPLSNTITPGRSSKVTKKLSTSSPKRLFSPSWTEGLKASSTAGHTQTKVYNLRVPKNASLDVGDKVVASKTKSERHRKRHFTSSDSLATFIHFEKTLPSVRNNTVCTVFKNDHLKGLKRNPSGTTTRKKSLIKKSKRVKVPQNNFPATKRTRQHDDFEMIENDNTADIDRNNKMKSEKEKSIPAELISLLASSTRKSRKKTRARSTIEILDDYRKRKGTRASLPRACKNAKAPRFKGRLPAENSDGETEQDSGNESDTDDDLNTKNKIECQSSEEMSRKEVAAMIGTSTNATSAGATTSPVKTTLKPRSRKACSPSPFESVQDLSLIAPRPVIDDSEYEAVGGCFRKRRSSDSQYMKSFRQIEMSPKGNRSKNGTLCRNINPDSSSKEDISKISRQKSSQLDFNEQELKLSKRKRSRRLNNSTNDFDAAKRSNERIPEHQLRIGDPSRNYISKSSTSFNSPSDLVSMSNEGSKVPVSPSCARKLVCVSPRRNKEQVLTHRKEEDALTNSTKKVRFDSSTTTFSVKIQIKTNLDASRQNNDGSEYTQSVPLSQSLNESAVQAIANQVTQACLTQARTSPGITCVDPGVKVDINVNEEGESSSHSSQNSPNSNQRSSAENEFEKQKRENEYFQDTVKERDVSIIEVRRQNCLASTKDLDDGRSIMSELTSDWYGQRPSRYDYRDNLGNERKKNSDFASPEYGVREKKNWKSRDDFRNGPYDVGIEKTLRRQNSLYGDDLSVSNAMKSSRAISKTGRYGETRPRSCDSRRKRVWGCGDSLAGSHVGSIASVTEGYSSSKIPREVSLCKPSIQYTGGALPRKGFNKTKRVPTLHIFAEDAGNDKISERSKDRTVEDTQVIPIAPSPARKSRLFPFSPGYRCGKCNGCQRTFDCQTCDTCLEKLHSYGSPRSPSVKEGLNVCLLRRCQRTCRVGVVDSLLGLKSSSNPLHSIHPSGDKDEKIHASSMCKSSSHSNLVDNSMGIDNKVLQDSRKSASKTMKAPWDEGDDWTVDYSYLSEPEYRRQWNKVAKPTASKNPSLSTRNLSTPSWSLPVNEKRRIAGFVGGGRTSLSSISESVVSQKMSRKNIASVPASNNKQVKGRRGGGKRKRGLLHGLALPITATDACSVTSWRENRKCLRALMEYDEADQDWL
jgi:hypothetical protein